jgi:hypothetical protein
MKTLKIFYTVEITQEVDISDNTLTRSEAQKNVDQILAKVVPENAAVFDWQWEDS